MTTHIIFLLALIQLFESTRGFSVVAPLPFKAFSNTQMFAQSSLSFQKEAAMTLENLSTAAASSVKPNTTIKRLSFLLSAQLIMKLQQQETSWRSNVTPTKNIEQMTIYLKMQVLCSTALEYARAATNNTNGALERPKAPQSQATISDATAILNLMESIPNSKILPDTIIEDASSTLQLQSLDVPVMEETDRRIDYSDATLVLDTSVRNFEDMRSRKSITLEAPSKSSAEISHADPRASPCFKTAVQRVARPVEVALSNVLPAGRKLWTLSREPSMTSQRNKIDDKDNQDFGVQSSSTVDIEIPTPSSHLLAVSPSDAVGVDEQESIYKQQVPDSQAIGDEQESIDEQYLLDSRVNTEEQKNIDEQQLLDTQKEMEEVAASEDELIQLRRNSADISHSFETKEFQPAWFAKNRHLQTIVGVTARQESMYFPALGNLALSKFQYDKRQRMETLDDDFFDVDWKFANVDDSHRTGEASQVPPIVLICHGLQSNSRSPLVKDMALAFNNIGMDAACINFRGCGGELGRAPMGYHLSFRDDLKLMVEHVSASHPDVPIYLSGFSLGANVVTHLLADLGSEATKYNICGAAVNAVPFDLINSQDGLDKPGFCKTAYGDRLLESLISRTMKSMEVCEYSFTKERLLQCKTLNEFDDLVVCSVYDFENAEDYHRKSSSLDRLDEIMVPQLVIQALDDPFMAGASIPSNDPNRPLRIQYTDHGGHCGYLFHANEDDRRETSWMPTQLSRFLEHVHDNRSKVISSMQTAPQNTAHPNLLPTVKAPSAEKAKQDVQRRQEAAKVSHGFEAREYVPAWYATNEHLQTIAGGLFRKETMYTRSKRDETSHEFVWDERERMETPDRDFFDVDWKYCDSEDCVGRPSDEVPLVLICHGLQSDSGSPLAQDMTMAFNNIGMDVACINFRGCGGEINRTPVGYHLGFTDDLKLMIQHVNAQFPGKRIYLSGFSLGANVVTTCLAELGDKARKHNIFGAAVNAVPFEMAKANLNLNEDGITKSLYGSRLLQSMIDRIEQSYDSIDFSFNREKAKECKTIMDMENLIIAPVFGFADAWDYYEKTSTLSKIDQVAVPQLVIQAKDDPFFKGQTNPSNDLGRPLRIHYTEHGGHCGYIFHSKEEENNNTSWMPTELARFLSHVEDNLARPAKETLFESSPTRPIIQSAQHCG